MQAVVRNTFIPPLSPPPYRDRPPRSRRPPPPPGRRPAPRGPPPPPPPPVPEKDVGAGRASAGSGALMSPLRPGWTRARAGALGREGLPDGSPAALAAVVGARGAGRARLRPVPAHHRRSGHAGPPMSGSSGGPVPTTRNATRRAAAADPPLPAPRARCGGRGGGRVARRGVTARGRVAAGPRSQAPSSMPTPSAAPRAPRDTGVRGWRRGPRQAGRRRATAAGRGAGLGVGGGGPGTAIGDGGDGGRGARAGAGTGGSVGRRARQLVAAGRRRPGGQQEREARDEVQEQQQPEQRPEHGTAGRAGDHGQVERDRLLEHLEPDRAHHRGAHGTSARTLVRGRRVITQ